MKIFNIVITTKSKIKFIINKSFDEGKNFSKKMDCAMVNPVIHSLKELRRNTWDIERVDQAIKWLEDNFIIDEDKLK